MNIFKCNLPSLARIHLSQYLQLVIWLIGNWYGLCLLLVEKIWVGIITLRLTRREL
jgi:hypothetical protein